MFLFWKLGIVNSVLYWDSELEMQSKVYSQCALLPWSENLELLFLACYWRWNPNIFQIFTEEVDMRCSNVLQILDKFNPNAATKLMCKNSPILLGVK